MSNSAAIPPATPAPRLKGGLVVPPHRHMPTLFSLIITWLVATTMATIMIPFLLTRHTDHYWNEPGTILLWALLSTVSTAHGAMGYLLGYHRGGQVVNFLIGGAPIWLLWGLALAGIRGASINITAVFLFPAALLLVWLLTRNREAALPGPPTGLVRVLDRCCFMMGNVWWGIAQLLVMFPYLVMGTVYDNSFGGNVGNEAAYARFYNAPPMGLIFVVFFVTLSCATLRKYPFRISQIGWLATHTGLLVLTVGFAVMFWGSYSGSTNLNEGETVDHAWSQSQRVLHVSIPSLAFEEDYLLEVDDDPAKSRVRQDIDVVAESQGKTYEFELVIDRFHRQAEFYEELRPHHHHEGEAPHGSQAGAQLRITAPRSSSDHILLERDRPSVQLPPNFNAYVQRVGSAAVLDGFTRRYGANDLGRGALVVQRGGGEIARLPILPAGRGQDPQEGADIQDPSATVAGSTIEIHVKRYFSSFEMDRDRGFVDSDPGRPTNPTLLVELNGPEGPEEHLVGANGMWFNTTKRAVGESRYGVELSYDCTPEITLPPTSMLVAVGPGESRSMVVTDAEGRTTVRPLKIGQVYRFSNESPFGVTPLSVLDDAEYHSGVRETRSESSFRAIHVVARAGGKHAEEWVPMGTRQAISVQLGEHRLELSYRPRKRDLGFAISLLDFRTINYPNATKPRAFETNIVLRDPVEQNEEALLVDMNHPLSYQGYQFFNQNPIDDTERNRRGVVFQVARNPGYPIIIFGAITTALGLYLVLFMKPSFKRMERRRRETRSAGSNVQLSPEGA